MEPWKELTEVRKLRNLSQSELAHRSGIPSSSISNFDSGKRRPSFNSLLELCEALDVSSDYLLGQGLATLQLLEPKEKLFADLDFINDTHEQNISDKIQRIKFFIKWAK